MKQSDSLVSIILPVCNCSKYLTRCLKSLLTQTYSDLEVIAIDDSSKDNSYLILKQFKNQDKRLRVFRNKKRYGYAVCLNRALKKARGKFIAFMNPLDLSGKDRIAKQIEYLRNNPKIAVVGTQCTFLNEKNRSVGKSQFPTDNQSIYKTLISGSVILFESVVINKEILPKDVFKFTTNMYPYMFIDVFLKIFQYAEFANLTDYLYSHRSIPKRINTCKKITKRFTMYVKHLIKSVAQDHYRPSLGSLFVRQTPMNTLR